MAETPTEKQLQLVRRESRTLNATKAALELAEKVAQAKRDEYEEQQTLVEGLKSTFGIKDKDLEPALVQGRNLARQTGVASMQVSKTPTPSKPKEASTPNS